MNLPRTTNRTASIVPLTVEHWPQVEAIYAAGIATGHATFESSPPSWEAFDTGKLPGQRLVAVDPAGRVLGWTAASAVSDRCVYAGVVEHSVYVDPAAQGHGVGAASSKNSSPPPRPPGSGPSSPAYSPRTRRVCGCTKRSGSRSSEPAAI